MEQYNNLDERLDEFIEKVALNFELTEIVNTILIKINRLHSQKKGTNLEIKDNKIIYSFDGRETGTKEIEVDIDNKKIQIEETGIKKIYNGTTNYTNQIVYFVEGTKTTNYNLIKQYDVINKENGNTLINAQIFKKYSYYDEMKYKGSSEEKYEKSVIKNQNNETVDEVEDNTQKVRYTLSNGDGIKIETINDQTKYYYYGKNTENDRIFYKEITKEEADRLLSLNDDAFAIINDDLVYNIRGTSYPRSVK